MTLTDNRIYPLDEVSQARIKSAVQILSLTEVVVELVKNALDAQAGSVTVVLNYAHGFCSVLDNGHGIPADEFSESGRLAQAYCTSKARQQGYTYGQYGRFLAALSGVSLLSITSRPADEESAQILWLNDSGHLSNTKELPDSTNIDRGTEVKVYNLFSKLPVRCKHLADRFANDVEVHKEFDRLKHTLTGLILAYPRPFELHVKHSASTCTFHHKLAPTHSTKMSNTSSAKTIEAVVSALHHAGYVGRAHGADWRQTSISLGEIKIHAVISLDPMPHKLVQFVAINHQPLTKQTHPELFQLVNTLFDNSSFGALRSGLDSTSSLVQGLKHSGPRLRQDQSKGVDRWPMFVIWISTDLDANDGFLHALGANPQIEQLMARITSLVEGLIEEFLISHGFCSQREPPDHQLQAPCEASSITDANLSPFDPSKSKQNFRHWSRVKSNRVSVMDNILTGLPFQNSKSNEGHTLLALRPNSHTRSSDSNATIVQDEPQTVPATIEEATDQSHAAVQWTEPQSGRTLRINSRTGMVLLDTANLPKTTTWSNSCTSHRDGVRTHRQGRRNKNRALPLEQVIQNVRRYSSGWPTNLNQPIRSIAPFNDHSESIEQQTQIRRKQTDNFWQSAGNCQVQCRAPASQLGMPRISKTALAHARILRQLDNKFILALMPGMNCLSMSSGKLVLIDQHAADERCKVEDLLRSVYEDEPVVLAGPLRFEVAPKEIQMLDTLKQYFAQWNIIYEAFVSISGQSVADKSVTDHVRHEVRVTALPAAIAERCRLSPKLIIELLREEIWSENPGHRIKSNPSVRHDNKAGTLISDSRVTEQHRSSTTARIPSRLLDLINSRACRSAIMFNDELTTAQCEKLVAQLSKCTLPFQCAHGRPSVIVLSELNNFLDHAPLTCDATTKTLTETELLDRDTNSAMIRSLSETTRLRSPVICGETREGRSAGQTLNTTASLTAGAQRHSALNTIDDQARAFGQAYRAWIETNTTPVQTPTLS